MNCEIDLMVGVQNICDFLPPAWRFFFLLLLLLLFFAVPSLREVSFSPRQKLSSFSRTVVCFVNSVFSIHFSVQMTENQKKKKKRNDGLVR